MPSQNYAKTLPGLIRFQTGPAILANSISTPTLNTSEGRQYVTFNGSQYQNNYDPSTDVAGGDGLFMFFVLRFTATGYFNIYDTYYALNPMLWVDGSGRFEMNAGAITSTEAYHDGKWHVVYAWHSASGSELWVDNVSIGTSGSAMSFANMNIFSRAGGQNFAGDALAQGVAVKLPNEHQRQKLYESLISLTTEGSVVNYTASVTGTARLVPADSTPYSPNVTDGFWMGTWFNFRTKTGFLQMIFGKEGAAGRDYVLFWHSGYNAFVFSVFYTGNARVDILTLSAPNVGEWCYIFAWYDKTNDLIGIRLNDHDPRIASTGGITVNDSGIPFAIGYISDGYYFDGRFDAAAWGKDPTGGMGDSWQVISDELYNNGRPVPYHQLTNAQKTEWGVTSYWNLDEASGDFIDSMGVEDLVKVNGATREPRDYSILWTPLDLAELDVWFDPEYGVYSDAGTTLANVGDSVYRWVSRNNPSIYAEQTNASYRPVLRVAANGCRYIDNTGSNAHMILTDGGACSYADSDPRTYSAHALHTSLSAYPMIIARGGKEELRLFSGSGRPEVIMNVSSSSATGPSSISTSTWYNFLGDFDGTETIAIALNGVDLTTTTASSDYAQSGTIYLGQREGAIGSYPFVGYYSNIIIAKQKMTAQEKTNWHNFCVARQPS